MTGEGFWCLVESPRVFSWIPGKSEGEERDRGEIGEKERERKERTDRKGGKWLWLHCPLPSNIL